MKMKLCRCCILPLEYKRSEFKELEGKLYCQYCTEYRKNPPNRNAIWKEWENYLNKLIKERKNEEYQGIFAYSGGKDSTLGLYLVYQFFKKQNANLLAFTIDHGLKGKRVWENIYRVINFLDVDWIKIDMSRHKDLFIEAIFKKEFPCDSVCKNIKNDAYKMIAKKYNADSLISGHDAMVKNSIITRKYEIPLYGSVAAYELKEDDVNKLIKKYGIPWKNPGYGEFDTDCLVPGIVFGLLTNWRDQVTWEEILSNSQLSLIMEYLANRVRMGLLSRKDAIKKLLNPRHMSREAIQEFKKITERKSGNPSNQDFIFHKEQERSQPQLSSPTPI